jgi:hypothetical protein
MKIPEMHAVSSRDNDDAPPRRNAALREAGAASCMAQFALLVAFTALLWDQQNKHPSEGYCYN